MAGKKYRKGKVEHSQMGLWVGHTKNSAITDDKWAKAFGKTEDDYINPKEEMFSK